MTNSVSRRSVLLAAAALPLAGRAQGADRIAIVVPYPPGSAPDFLARLLSTRLAAALGKTVVVDNRPGANAIIGSDFVTKARPDGTTLLLVDRMTVVANPLLYPKLPYDPKNLQAVSDVARVNLLLTARGDAPYRNWNEFVAYSKSNPGKVSVGTGGAGSVHHLSLELMARATGAQFTHVPYKGISPAVQDMLGGQLSAVISGLEVVRPHLGSGKVRVLATGADARSQQLPEVPTLRELGIASTVLLPTTFSLFAPRGTPDAALEQVAAQLRKVLQQPEVAVQLADLGLLPTPSEPAQVRAGLDALGTQLSALIREANIRLE
jgi:tripartite-type tricarboxylate transporter receptor subunit TctC